MEYSKKNIPIPSQEEYKVYLISKVKKFIKRMRWKVYLSENSGLATLNPLNYSF